MNTMEGMTALITGGAGGIGAATTRRFLGEGANVVVADTDEAAAVELAGELGAKVRGIKLDVRDEAQWSSVVETTVASFDRLDVLVNNAGVFRPASIGDLTVADIRLSMDVNLMGTLLGIQAVVPAMRRGGGGSILNVSSGAGLGGYPGQLVYGATKWAVRGLTKTAAMELGGVDGIRVNSIHPGAVDTPMIRSVASQNANAFDHNPVPRVAQPDEIAALIVYLSSGDAAYITGAEVAIDGGLGAGPGLFNPAS